MTSSIRNKFFFPFALLVLGAIIKVAEAKPPSRISEAVDAQPGVYKWAVSISNEPGAVFTWHSCGGSIISSRHILTAAHCFAALNASSYDVRAGITNLEDGSALVANVSHVIKHPDYVSAIPGVRRKQNDIAILVLDRDLELGERVTKISLPTSSTENHQNAYLTGWGLVSEDSVASPSNLKFADVQVMDDNECVNEYGEDVFRAPQFFCGIQENGNALGGDSGSGLISGEKVIGIVASGTGIPHVPDFYTNVYHYLDWINSTVRSSSVI